MAQAGEVRVRISAKDQASTAIGKVTGLIKGLVGAYLGFRGAQMAIRSMQDMIRAAAEQEAATVNLTAALKQQGVYTQQLRDDMLNYASALQATTIHGDEAITQAQVLLMRLGVTPQYINAATKATLNWADALGKDLNSAALDIGKAFTGNLMMLQRYGVRIDAQTVKTKGFSAVLEELEKKFGGASEAMASTFQGRMKQIGNLMGDVKEQIGGAIVNSAAWKELLKAVSQEINNLNKWLQENQATIQEWGKNLALLVIETARTLGEFFNVLIQIPAKMAYISREFEKLIGIKTFKDIDEALIELGNLSQDASDKLNTLADTLEDRIITAFHNTTTAVQETNNQALKPLGDGLAAINLQLDAMGERREQVRFWWQESWIEGIKDVSGELKSEVNNWDLILVDFCETMTEYGHHFLDSFIDSIFEGQRAFHQLVADFLIGISKMIAKALILKGIKLAFGVPFASGGLIPAMQHGGLVYGAGGRDMVPAQLTAGEYVFRKQAVQRYGKEELDRMNYGAYNNTYHTPISITIQSSGNAAYDVDTLKTELKRVLPEVYRDNQRRRKL